MGVALQAGMLAGGVVFVPMALAGWHLTRNRVLFFSAALFIVLAVTVHLLPYFPSMSSMIYSIHSPWPYPGVLDSLPPKLTPVNCVSHLHDLVWRDGEPREFMSSTAGNVSTFRDFDWEPTGRAADKCKFQKLNTEDMVELFRGTWIVVAGDSQLRFFFLSLLDLLMPDDNPINQRPMERHTSYEHTWEEENIRLQFVWAPFSVNLTRLVVEYRHNHTYPDVLVMGAGLWHMLHLTNSSHYGESLSQLQRAIVSLFPSSSYTKSLTSANVVDTWSKTTLQVPHMFWLNSPALIRSMLNTERKRERMTAETSQLYEDELRKSKLVRPEGPMTLVNMKKLSQGCGPFCTIDGMHYNYATYEAAVHVVVNALLIATQQSPAT
ncbi:hypothetical protein MPTK1_7g13020 [Marchantia polymorpha subsp. ruderalis]|uniref:SGNH domain-containing protein n=2 Tax=Marchantia polymorpha TaxID=3197 RepID=A0AAF6BZ11_MARPO|nr:hypothetical protein MARPO_0003s0310 [Marchantia polymorpha]PTQ49481.1 hypothetical protein MARPO_0003s0310 [Marchantia polymorpha]BBN17245.1 hypothetical protein Mp_7g13020 [Marchantia polymorpha subsp. ruderalis]BBN17246.1 hypothetical protein Mp_7g13020 [Marchantia polymorpha subsp. ruderalis]|eukprot:PTQ49480.1 hypothetical protein MARPO_0003s0310 [Marchantia polymorpha]